MTIDVPLKTPVAEGDPSASDGGTAGTGSRGGRGTKGDNDRHRRTKGSPKAGEETTGSVRGPIPRGFATRLLSWYRAHRRDLPWRRTRDPYRIWVSEVMLQQTTVRAVIPYYESWLERFPDLRSLARAPLRDVLRAWQGLGYYQRARNLHRAAGAMTREHAGLIPDDAAALRKLPGFGPYTTAAVLSLAYGRPLPLIDANVRRVLMRLLSIEGGSSPSLDGKFADLLGKVIPASAPGDFNQAIMELGALVCRSANPQCLLCPVREFCRAAADGTQETIPRPRRLEVAKIEAAVAVIVRDGRFLIRRRPDKGLLAGLWEFPGGKREDGESLVETLRREVREEVGAGIEGVRFLTTVGHAYTRFQVTLHVYSCRFRRAPALPPKDFRWVTLRSIRRYPLPSGSVRIVDFLAAKKSV